MTTTRNTKLATKTDNRPTAQAVEHAWRAYDAAMGSGASTAKCTALHREYMALVAERRGI